VCVRFAPLRQINAGLSVNEIGPTSAPTS
jgi:hypothetical protein